MLSKINEFVKRISATNSRNEKERILKEYENDEVVRSVLYFVYNPYIITGISKKKVKMFEKCVSQLNIVDTNILEVMSYLKENHTGKNEVLMYLESFMRNNMEYRELIENIITKDLKLGIQSTTINKVYGKDTIPTFDVMLAHKYFDAPEKYVPDGEEFMLSTKLDGVRCVCIRDDTGVKFFSRQGQPILDMVDIEEEAMHLPVGYVYDGELLLNNIDNLDSKDLYRATVKVTGSDGDKTNLTFNVFDLITLDGFKQGYDKHATYLRKSMLSKILGRYNYKHIKEVKSLYWGSDKNQIQYWLDKITSEGGEGVMINLSYGHYECKRSRHLLKVKKMQTCDVLVKDVIEGTGQNVGKLGAITVEFVGPDSKHYECNCGSGFTLQEREDFWNDPNLILGKIVELQYFEISQNEQGTYAFRFPVFKYVRNDKTSISMH